MQRLYEVKMLIVAFLELALALSLLIKLFSNCGYRIIIVLHSDGT